MTRLDPSGINEFNRTVGGMLAELRTARNLTQREVAQAIELSVSQIRRFELGYSSPPACVFFDMIEFYQGNWAWVEYALFKANVKLRRIDAVGADEDFEFPMLKPLRCSGRRNDADQSSDISPDS